MSVRISDQGVEFFCGEQWNLVELPAEDREAFAKALKRFEGWKPKSFKSIYRDGVCCTNLCPDPNFIPRKERMPNVRADMAEDLVCDRCGAKAIGERE